MTTTRIASALIVPFAIGFGSLVALACSSDDNNGGSGPTPVGGAGSGGTNGGAGTNGTGNAGTNGTGNAGTNGGGDAGSNGGADCEEQCTTDNADGVDAFNNFFVQDCGCAAGAACATECGATCSGGQVDQTCGDCLNGLDGNAACIKTVISDCQGDAACTAALTCLSGCGDSGGGGGGGDVQACQQQCGKDNQAGIAAYQADSENVESCLCTGDTCKDKCADSPICKDGTQSVTQECFDCQDNCFPTCKADAACSALLDCLKGCQLDRPGDDVDRVGCLRHRARPRRGHLTKHPRRGLPLDHSSRGVAFPSLAPRTVRQRRLAAAPFPGSNRRPGPCSVSSHGSSSFFPPAPRAWASVTPLDRASGLPPRGSPRVFRVWRRSGRAAEDRSRGRERW
jgi:hypothetical protein